MRPLAFLRWVVGLFTGNGPLVSVVNALEKAHSDALTAKTDQERVASQERVATLEAALGDVASARASLSAMPRWVQVTGAAIAWTVALHVVVIGVGTTLVAPFYFDAASGRYLNGSGPLEWTRHVPLFPSTLADLDLWVISFIFGSRAVISGVGAIAGALGRK